MRAGVLILLIVFSLLPLTIVVHANDASTAYDITGDTVLCVLAGGDDWYRKYVTISSGSSLIIYLRPTSQLDVDLYVYDASATYCLGSSAHGMGQSDSVTINGPYTGYIYIKVHHFAGSGYYSLGIGTSPPDPDEYCSLPSPPPSGGSGSSSSSSSSSDDSWWDRLINAIRHIASIPSRIADAIENAINTLREGVNRLVNAIKDFFSAIGHAIAEIVLAPFKLLKAFVQGVVNGLHSIWEGIKNALHLGGHHVLPLVAVAAGVLLLLFAVM